MWQDDTAAISVSIIILKDSSLIYFLPMTSSVPRAQTGTLLLIY